MYKLPLFTLLFYTNTLIAQPHIQQALCDNNWIIGYGSAVVTNTSPCSQITNLPTLTIQPKASSIRFNETCASISDSLGNLLFYTNGIHIANKNYQIMQGSDTLNLGYWSSPDATIDGYRTVQGALILPAPNHQSIYYVFHTRLPSPDEPNFYLNYSGHREGAYYTKVDISTNNGLGRVTNLRNPIIVNDSLDGRLLACRHANGRDWWILNFRFSTGEYMPVLLDPQGVHTTRWQRAANTSNFTLHGSVGQSTFSPDGTKFAVNNTLGYDGNFISLYDFDRCNGLISNPRQYNFSDSSGAAGISFSPNSCFLYFNSANILLQIDANTTNPFNHIDTIAHYDGFTEFGASTNFYLQQLTVDNYIYMCSPNGTRYFHTINNPNQQSQDCSFIQRNITIPTFNAFTLPNFPNFRLGTLSNSMCDTLTVSSQQAVLDTQRIHIFPNPTSDILTITISNNTTALQYKLYDVMGREVQSGMIESPIDLKTIANGIYFIAIYNNTKRLTTQKIVVFKN
jgi:Secretion system C-terminal sorting domain